MSKKQEFHGYIARDKPPGGQIELGSLFFYPGKDKPFKNEDHTMYYVDYCTSECVDIDDELFKNVTWRSGPKKVKLVIVEDEE